MEWLTARLRIGPLVAGDVEVFQAYRAAPEIRRYQGWYPETMAAADQFIAAQAGRDGSEAGWTQWAIRLRDDGRLVGDLGICLPEDMLDHAEIGITMAPEHQGHGYAREALHALLDWAFVTRGVRRVIGSVDPRNDGSLRLLAALGMRREAHHREAFLLRGEWVDDVIFAILAREWPTKVS